MILHRIFSFQICDNEENDEYTEKVKEGKLESTLNLERKFLSNSSSLSFMRNML